jgi:hypothetical protein
MALRIQPGDVGEPPGEHQQLLSGDELSDLERVVAGETNFGDSSLCAPDLTHDVHERSVGEVIDEVLRQRRPVGVTRAATRDGDIRLFCQLFEGGGDEALLGSASAL